MTRKTFWTTAAILALATLASFPFDHGVAALCHDIPQAYLPPVRFVTHMGESQYILIPALLLMLACRKKRMEKAFRTAWLAFAAVAGSGLIVQILKYMFGRARPKALWSNGLDGFYGITGSSSLTSFPSGHATTAVAVTLVLGLAFPKLRVPLACYVVLVAASRILLLQHFPSDILGGALVAFLVTIPLAKRIEIRV